MGLSHLSLFLPHKYGRTFEPQPCGLTSAHEKTVVGGDKLHISIAHVFQTLHILLHVAILQNLTYNLEPVYSILLAMLIFNEYKELNPSFFLGLSLIIISVVLQTWSKLKITLPKENRHHSKS